MEASSQWRKRRGAVKAQPPCPLSLLPLPAVLLPFLLRLLVSIISHRGLLRVILCPTSFSSFTRRFTSGIYQGMSSIYLFSRHVLNLSLPLKLLCGPQRGITITKVHVRIVLCGRDSCGRNSTLASLFLPSCGYLKRRATTLGRPPLASTPLCSRQTEQGTNRKLPQIDCRQGCPCCLMIPHRRFLFGMDFSPTVPQPEHQPKHVSL